MPREMMLFGALVPTLVPAFLISGIMMLLLDRLLARRGIYSMVWHPALFRVAIFTGIFSGIGLFIY